MINVNDKLTFRLPWDIETAATFLQALKKRLTKEKGFNHVIRIVSGNLTFIMAFLIDQQTNTDLSLTGKSGEATIISLFRPVTFGGIEKLNKIFTKPLPDLDSIKNRIAALAFIQKNELALKFSKEESDFIEHYLNLNDRPEIPSVLSLSMAQAKYWFKPNSHIYSVKRGISLLLNVLSSLSILLNKHKSLPLELNLFKLTVNKILDNPIFSTAKIVLTKKTLTIADYLQCDYLFRHTEQQTIKAVLEIYYTLDVYIAIVKTAKELGFSNPAFVDSEQRLEIVGFFHPLISKPVLNDISFNDKNVCFLTGANMAGKSSSLKAIGICFYLAHIGFPVPARKMTTSYFSGLLTTINLSDNIVAGHSHFYKEVLRIKEVAYHIGNNNNLLVIFDELFRGTNLKDAHEASSEIIKAFADVKGSLFIISTHIVEVADELSNLNNLFFKCFETSFHGEEVIYNYRLIDGISQERLGMYIVKNEKLVEIIKMNNRAQ